MKPRNVALRFGPTIGRAVRPVAAGLGLGLSLMAASAHAAIDTAALVAAIGDAAAAVAVIGAAVVLVIVGIKVFKWVARAI